MIFVAGFINFGYRFLTVGKNFEFKGELGDCCCDRNLLIDTNK